MQSSTIKLVFRARSFSARASRKPALDSFLLLMALGLAFVSTSGQPAGAQRNVPSPAAAGCTLEKDTYTCNWQAFRPVLAAARTVAVETQPMDRFTAAQLRELIGKLGKKVAAPGEPADLTLLLIPAESTGISMGPEGQAVATLRIYAAKPEGAAGPEGGRGPLVWVETLFGHPDRPWPASVHELIGQFRDRVGDRAGNR